MTALELLNSNSTANSKHTGDANSANLTSTSASSPVTTQTNASPSSTITKYSSSKKYHLNRYNQEQQSNEQRHCASVTASVADESNPTTLCTSTSTPPHSPLPSRYKTSALATTANENLTPSDVVVSSTPPINIIVETQRASSMDDEEELPLIQTPPQSTASSISLCDNAMASTSLLSMTQQSSRERKSSCVAPEVKATTRISQLRQKIQRKHELLKENLKSSYTRLRQSQTRHFQMYIDQQLRQLIENTQRNAHTKDNVDQEATLATTVDKKQIDLLTSIVKSNLSEQTSSSQHSPSESELNRPKPDAETDSAKPASENVIVKSLIEDIQYEIVKQNDEKKRRERHANNKSSDLTSESESDVDDEIEEIVDAKENTSEFNDRSKWFWNMRRVQLGNEWDKVQTKLRYLADKNKECNEYLEKQTLKSQQNDSSSDRVAVDSTQNIEQQAIAELEQSLQKCVESSSTSSSRCWAQPIRKMRGTQNLAGNDLVRFDDDHLKSVYATLVYMNKQLFKTVCWCSQMQHSNEANPIKSSHKRQQSSEQLSTTKTCIFCHLVRQYESNLKENQTRIRQARNRITPQPSPLTDQSNSSNYKQRASVELIKRDHSYCKTNDLMLGTPKVNCQVNYRKRKTELTKNLNRKRQKSNKNVNSNEDDIIRFSPESMSSTTSTISNRTMKNNLFLLDDDDNKFLDDVVIERLNRLFGYSKNSSSCSENANKKKILFDNNEFYDLKLGQQRLDHDQVSLDSSNLDIDPSEIYKLPDLTYEELEFLNNEIDQNLNDLSFYDENDDIENDEEEDDTENDLCDQENSDRGTETSRLHASSNGSLKYLYTDSIYRPSYRSIISSFKKRSRLVMPEDENCTSLDAIGKNEFSEYEYEDDEDDDDDEEEDDDIYERRNQSLRLQLLVNRLKQLAIVRNRKLIANKFEYEYPNLTTMRRLIARINDQMKRKRGTKNYSQSKTGRLNKQRPRYRQRSTSKVGSIKPRRKGSVHSSASSTSSEPNESASLNKSHGVLTTSLPSMKNCITNSHYIYLNNQFDKFDINNIVIPTDMINNCKVLNVAKCQDLPTPKWRISPIREAEFESHAVDDDLNACERDDDQIYIRRHDAYELKKRYESLVKHVEKEKKNKLKNNHHHHHHHNLQSNHNHQMIDEYCAFENELQAIRREFLVSDHRVHEPAHIERFRKALASLELDLLQRNKKHRTLSDAKVPENGDKVEQHHHVSSNGEETGESILPVVTRESNREIGWHKRQFPLNDSDYERIIQEDLDHQLEQENVSYLKLFQVNQMKLLESIHTHDRIHQASKI